MLSAARALTRARPVLLSARAALTLTLTLVLCLLAAPGAFAAPAEWSLAPAGGGRPSFYAEGPAGTVLQDTVVVTNPGRAPVVVRLSGTGLRTVFAGEAGNGIRVPARTRAEVPFTVTVPAGAAPGDRSGAVVARDTRGRTATVPVRLRVGGPALAALTVEHLAVHADRITYELVNRGTTVLAPRLALRADGVLGRVLDRAPRTLPVHLRPGARVKLTEPWPDRPALDAVEVRLTATAPGGAHDTATTSARFVRWPTVAGVALFAGAVAALAARRRHRVHLRPGARVKLTEPWPDRPELDAVDVRLTVTAPGGAHDTATTSARFVRWPTVAGVALFAGAVAALAARRRHRPTPTDDPSPEDSAPAVPRPSAPTPGVPAPDGLVSRVASSDPVTIGTPAPDGLVSRVDSSDPVTIGTPAPDGLVSRVASSDPVTIGTPAPDGLVSRVATSDPVAPGSPAAPEGPGTGPLACDGPTFQVSVSDSLTTGSLAPTAPPPDGPAPEGPVTSPLMTGASKPGRPTPSGSTPAVAVPDGPAARVDSSDPVTTGTPDGPVTGPLATGVPKSGRAVPGGPSSRTALGASKDAEPFGRPSSRPAPGGVQGAVAAGVPYPGGELTEGAVK
ncbi:hypothetical protein [Streptomyces sp. NPDC001307]|uniref:hypothetical protein n=1 Tax=Streptomyces sp. NPDC001307 TaxID=3364560 RepID=UPI003674276C